MKKYRPNVGVVVFNEEKKVLLCQRNGMSSSNSWQFPQGGIELEEDAISAGLRELKEETSVVSVRFVAKHKKLLRYDFPKEMASFYKKPDRWNYVGQEQTWILLYFYGNDSEINLETPEKEFSNYKWSSFSDAIEKVWEVKKEVYEQVKEYFEPIVEKYVA
jgi:putative (di)nucleoside polyphosphate hydrolase